MDLKTNIEKRLGTTIAGADDSHTRRKFFHTFLLVQVLNSLGTLSEHCAHIVINNHSVSPWCFLQTVKACVTWFPPPVTFIVGYTFFFLRTFLLFPSFSLLNF